MPLLFALGFMEDFSIVKTRYGRPAMTGTAKGMREWRDVWVDVQGCAWRARVATGAGGRHYAPVLLVHGFGISSSYFVPLIRGLAPEFDVYAPDLPGHGRSGSPRRALGIVELAEGLAGWMDETGLSGASVVAHSMGTQVAVELALGRPDLAGRVALIGPTLYPDARRALPALSRLLLGSGRERPSMMGLIVKDYSRMAPRLLGEFRAMQSHRLDERLAGLDAPILLVRGEKDRIAPQHWLDSLAELARRADRVVVPKAGHAVHYSHVDALLPRLVVFLKAAGDVSNERSGSGGFSAAGH